MPCRALEAFRLRYTDPTGPRMRVGLNALSGIGGVQTQRWLCHRGGTQIRVLMPCRALEAFRRGCGVAQNDTPDHRLNALSGIGGVQTNSENPRPVRDGAARRLNALSGIGGVQTDQARRRAHHRARYVLMPCRALEAFRPERRWKGDADAE